MLQHIKAARANQRGNGNIVTGTVCTMLAMLLFAVMNTGAKLLTGHHPLEIGFYRNLFGTFLFGAIILWQGKTHLLNMSSNKGLVLGRSVIGYLNLVFSFSAFQALPMANTQTLLFTGSLLVPLLGFVFLGERIGRYRYAVIISGFAGVCLIAGPTAELSALGVTWALLAALCQAAQAILLRHIGKADSPLTISFWFMAIGIILAGAAMPWVATVPDTREILILACLAIAGTAWPSCS
ncbi:MAG: DMT family transporter [Pseudomonadota bacterium]|nr:DMT family transporter [Pseudomonadota bacterium]